MFFFYRYGDHLNLHVLTHSCPTRRSSDLVLSNVALVDLFGDIAAGEDSGSAAAAVASDLRSAYVDQDRDDRLSALRALWDAGDDPFDRYGRLVMTARAAARVAPADKTAEADARSEEHTSELQSLMRISYAVFCLKKKHKPHINATIKR